MSVPLDYGSGQYVCDRNNSVSGCQYWVIGQKCKLVSESANRHANIFLAKRREQHQLVSQEVSTMDALEAMKDKGNALFQQQRFTEAVQVYTSVLEKLRDSHVAAVRLEGAVRLNRAWAWIQMPGSESSESALVAAEQDCSAVIGNDPACVKAFYRRALARERRGHWKVEMTAVLWFDFDNC